MVYEITVLQQGQETKFLCDSEQYLYKMMRRAGVASGGCDGGACGVCKVKIISGAVNKRRMSCDHVTKDELDQGIVLACCVKPSSDIIMIPLKI
jgi:ferredoxin